MPGIRSTYTDSINFFGNSSPFELIEKYGSPLYVYNEKILRRSCRDMLALADHPAFKVCYSAKANGNPNLLHIVRQEGLRVDSLSPGELAVVKAAGFTREEIVFVCNNVSPEELALAAREASAVSVDSLSQLRVFGQTVPGGRVMLRLNPGIGAGHHEKVITAGKSTKFGINPEYFDEAKAICREYNLSVVGVNQHLGSLFMEADSFMRAASWLLDASLLFGRMEYIDFGGGFGIPYRKYDGEARLDLSDFRAKFSALLREWSAKHDYRGLFVVEPGRYVAAECGLLLGSVTATKNNGETRYACTDVGFNILPRPMLYDAWHDVEVYRPGVNEPDKQLLPQTVVGNICESGDILAKGRELPEIKLGDILGFLDAGAYCYAMASSYNQRVRPAEVLIDASGEPKLIRRREEIEDLLRLVVDQA